MSNIIRCDGPACDETKDPDAPARLCTVPWIRVEPDGTSSTLDFHADACVVAYFSQHRGTTTTVTGR
jgi:hypothetical protein